LEAGGALVAAPKYNLDASISNPVDFSSNSDACRIFTIAEPPTGGIAGIAEAGRSRHPTRKS
jgi:hypothetical protein